MCMSPRQPRRPTKANSSHTKAHSSQPKAYDGQRQSSKAYEGQWWPKTSNTGQRRAIQANKGLQWPTTANIGPRVTTANEFFSTTTTIPATTRSRAPPHQPWWNGPKRRVWHCLGPRYVFFCPHLFLLTKDLYIVTFVGFFSFLFFLCTPGTRVCVFLGFFWYFFSFFLPPGTCVCIRVFLWIILVSLILNICNKKY